MDVPRDIILIVLVLGIFAFGYFLMARIDKFLAVNRKAIEKENEKKEPSCVMLAEDMTDAEVAEEVRNFRKKHKGARIILYDSQDTEISEIAAHYTEQKQ